jgi:hypothetical protein
MCWTAGTIEDVGGLGSCMQFSREMVWHSEAISSSNSLNAWLKISVKYLEGDRQPYIWIMRLLLYMLGSGTQFEPA